MYNSYEAIKSFQNGILYDKKVMALLGIVAFIDGELPSTRNPKAMAAAKIITTAAQFAGTTTVYPLMITINNAPDLGGMVSSFTQPQIEISILYEISNADNAYKLNHNLLRLFSKATLEGLIWHYEGTSPPTVIKNNQEKISMRFSTNDTIEQEYDFEEQE